jgi:ABC-type sugar transport system substrate-binding protein
MLLDNAKPLPHTVLTGLALLGALVLLTACGAADPTPTQAPADQATATAIPSGGDGWRSGVQKGGVAGQRAEATSVLLADGSAATLEERADGKPLLLYFFATW